MESIGYNVVFLFIAGMGTALACGLGTIPVFLLGDRIDAWRPALWGLAAGLMVVASVEGLFQPALRSGEMGQTVLGLLIGVGFVLVTHRLMHSREVKVQGLRGADVSRSALIFVVLLIHGLPEGMAIGAAQASAVEGLNVFIIVAIALHHLPEGAVVAIPMASAGFRKQTQFWAAVLTSAPEPIGAPLAYLLVDRVTLLLPVTLAIAGGAMLAAVVLELAPEALSPGTWRKGSAGMLAGGAIMVALSTVLGVTQIGG